MRIGSRYSSYEEFEAALKKYENTVFQKFWIRDGRTISNQREKFPRSVDKANDALKYYRIRLACDKGGRIYKSRKIKPYRKSTTKKQKCNAMIFLKLSKCQQYLTVAMIYDKHNHPSLKTCPTQRFPMKKANIQAKLLLTKTRKLEIMNTHCKLLSKLCMESPTEIFTKRVNLIKDLIELWNKESGNLLSDGECSTMLNIQEEESIDLYDSDEYTYSKNDLVEDVELSTVEDLSEVRNDVEKEYLETEYLEEEYLQEVFKDDENANLSSSDNDVT